MTLLTVSRKKAKILTVNRKSHYPIVTLIFAWAAYAHFNQGMRDKFDIRDGTWDEKQLVTITRWLKK